MWLRDFLAEDLPNCRTMVYGYNSNLHSRGIHTLDDYKIEFLNEEVKRPIIFIGHSFGGIVIVHSLVEAATRKGEMEAFVANSNLVAATCAVMFFGTPHRGILMEDVSKMLGDHDVHNSRIKLLDEIKNGPLLETDLNKFKTLVEGFKVVSFYERLQTAEVAKDSENRYTRSGNYKSTVDTDSALLHLLKGQEDKIPVNSDHTNIVKFENRLDATYENVIVRIQKYIESAPADVMERFDALRAGADISSLPPGSWWEVIGPKTPPNTNPIANTDERKTRKRTNSNSDGQQTQKRNKTQGQIDFSTSNASDMEHQSQGVPNLSLEVGTSEDVIQVGGIYKPPNHCYTSMRHGYDLYKVDILEKIKQILQPHGLTEPLEDKSYNPEMGIVVQTSFGQKIAVLHGMGGAGKSQIALEFAYRFIHCYSAIFWIDADNISRTADSVQNVLHQIIGHYTTKWRASPDYSEIANILGIPGKVIIDKDSGNLKPIDMETAKKAIHNWLGKQENKRWLLLIDNHDNAERELDTLIPVCDWGRVVVTTRLPELDSFGGGVEIGSIGSEAGLELLLGSSRKNRQTVNDNELREAENIVRALCELPLALDQAGAYIRLSHISFSDYQEKLKKGMKAAFRKKLTGIGLSSEKASVLATWELSFQALSENARHLLHICAFLSNEDIPDDLFRRGKSAIQWIKEETNVISTDENNLDDAIQSLFSFSLAKRKESGRSFWIHPLVHAWVRENTDINVQRQNALDTVSLVASAEKALGKDNPSTLETMSKIAWVICRQRRYDEQLVLLKRILEWKENALGKDDPSTLETVIEIAVASTHNGNNEGLVWLKRILEWK
ncbi:hypothetical protein RUND412_010075 [Rhizina undulata]